MPEASWYEKQEAVTGNALVRWPLERRVEFLSHLGVSARNIVGKLAEMKEPHVPVGLDAAKAGSRDDVSHKDLVS